VHIAYHVRVYRFAHDIIEHILTKHGSKIEVESVHQHAFKQKLAEDVVFIIIIFGGRVYGIRS
jgi:predicted site-specific integrase-resolvase